MTEPYEPHPDDPGEDDPTPKPPDLPDDVKDGDAGDEEPE